MKNHIFLPLTLLLAFSTVQSEEVAPATEQNTATVETTTAPEAITEQSPATEPAQEATVAPEATPTAPAEATEIAPAPVAPVTQPAVMPAVETEQLPDAQAAAIPDETAIIEFFKLVAAYNKQASVIRSLQELASGQSEPVTANEASVRSLLALLELHKKEANLINKLRAALVQSYATIKDILGSWDEETAQLVGQKQAKPAKQKQKAQVRDVNYESVKNLAETRPQTQR